MQKPFLYIFFINERFIRNQLNFSGEGELHKSETTGMIDCYQWLHGLTEHFQIPSVTVSCIQLILF